MMADDKLKRYEKIDFLGEGQVSNLFFCYFDCKNYKTRTIRLVLLSYHGLLSLFTERYLRFLEYTNDYNSNNNLWIGFKSYITLVYLKIACSSYILLLV